MKHNAMFFVGMTISTWSVFASGVVQNVTARQIQPWNELVEIEYELSKDINGGDFRTTVVCEDRESGINYTATSFGRAPTYEKGIHRLIWNAKKDGVSIVSKQVVFRVAVDEIKYCVIDLSNGKDATEYPVSYLLSEPSDMGTDIYKTSKLILRCIAPGSFKMGGSYDVELTKPFYMGVFEVTQKQYELVTGTNPSYYKGASRPVETVSCNAIRGSSAGARWPASNAVDATSFLGKLRAKTGLDFDLPTEAQWEFACRAGTDSSYNNGGSTESDLKKVGRYTSNQNDGKGGYSRAHTTVGSYLPNAWGLYDMHGNVVEWCLDRYGSYDTSTDPKGASSGSQRVVRGGGWYSAARDCTSSYRSFCLNLSAEDYMLGFRLARTLQ